MNDDLKKVWVITNITLNPFLRDYLSEVGEYNISFEMQEQTIEEVINKKDYSKQEKRDVNVVWINLESLLTSKCDIFAIMNNIDAFNKLLDELINICDSVYKNVKQSNDRKIVWILFEDYYMSYRNVMGNIYIDVADRLNNKIMDYFKGCTEISFLDMKSMIAQIGIKNAYSIKNKMRWNLPYSKEIMRCVANEIFKQYFIDNGMSKKCIVVDCDNVLWGGIVSEEGFENIKLSQVGLGREFYEFQRFLLMMYKHGIILAICSKNDIEDVEYVFSNNEQMVLKMENISCLRVNWRHKYENVLEIAQELNISLDSIVFVDDSELEIIEMETHLPQVKCVRYNRNSIYAQLSCFNICKEVDYDIIKKRHDTYKTNQLRTKLQSKYKENDEYLEALQMKIDIHMARPLEISRISELSQRTNRFTNGKRYTVTEINEICCQKKGELFVINLTDRYSDLGLVGAFEVRNNVLVMFCISCRALGRNIELDMFRFLKENFDINEIQFSLNKKNNELKQMMSEAFPEAVFINL